MLQNQLHVEPAANARPPEESERQRRKRELDDRAGTEADMQPSAVGRDRQYDEQGACAHRPDSGDRDAVRTHPADHLPPHRARPCRHDPILTCSGEGRDGGSQHDATAVHGGRRRSLTSNLRPFSADGHSPIRLARPGPSSSLGYDRDRWPSEQVLARSDGHRLSGSARAH